MVAQPPSQPQPTRRPDEPPRVIDHGDDPAALRAIQYVRALVDRVLGPEHAAAEPQRDADDAATNAAPREEGA